MQFVKNGPDVPDRLLQMHEDGHVVFFCGAGISYPACLPGFACLVSRIYDGLNVAPDRLQKAAIKDKRFDTAISLLERGIVNGRATVRVRVAKILTPNLDAPHATATHEALLALSRTRELRTRIVTTNFDRLFEEVISTEGIDVERFQAPLLPVPKSRWSGLVYLHGLLPTYPEGENLDHLILSSGDFGLAYLTERWAARFVGELFRNYTVCFVGYSLDDPVLRYMTDALAADRLLGESPAEMFAFGSHSKGEKNERAKEWRAKNVTPILYRKFRRHWYLHKTLREWAATHRDGIGAKERIIVDCASSRPVASTKQDDFVGRVLWALSDASGVPAKRFADLDPVPSLDWLEFLYEDRYQKADSGQFDVPSHVDENDVPEFSLIRRPFPPAHAPLMTFVDDGAGDSFWDIVMHHLARWMIRHLDDPALVVWLVERGGRIHPKFVELVARRMEEFDGLEANGKTGELNRIRANAPRAVPRPLMRTLWRVLLAGRVKSSRPTFDIFRWIRRFRHDGLTTTLRLQLREILAPCVSLNKSFHLDEDRERSDRTERLDDLVYWRVVLSSENAHSRLLELREDPRWAEALPRLLDDFSNLLRDALDLLRELGGANDKYDPSVVWRPSISDHSQNTYTRDWTVLIDLTREAWLATADVSPERARLAAESWLLAPYPLFRRLAYFAAAQKGIIPPRQGLDWLFWDDHWWLWSPRTQRETTRLLVALAPALDAELSAELEQAVLEGPPRAMYKPDRWIRIADYGIWLRLAKMDSSGGILTVDAKARLTELASQHPEWRLESDEREEFPIWGGESGDGRMLVRTPRRRRELVDWLKHNPEPDVWQGDDWLRRCVDDFPTAACALCSLARDGEWPEGRWGEALRAWSGKKQIKRSWRYMSPVLDRAPKNVLHSLASDMGSWLQDVAKGLDGYDGRFLELCKRLLALEYDLDDDEDDPVGEAINHPVGRVTEALLDLWVATSLKDGQGLAPELRAIFTEICDVRFAKFRHGRVMLASRAVPLFRVDREWTVRHLFPLFDWQSCETEARGAWEGFLWSPRLYRPMLEFIKHSFLDTVNCYEMLGRHREQYSRLLTFVALDPGDTFTTQQLQKVTGALPDRGLRRAADALADALEGAGRQRAEHWRNRTLPYLRKIWPNSIDRRTPAISESLGRVCIAAQDAFPAAMEELRGWLQPLQYPGVLMHRLNGSELCCRFPEPALDFLDLTISENVPQLWNVKSCLEQIRTAQPELENDGRFQRLRNLLRSRGREM